MTVSAAISHAAMLLLTPPRILCLFIRARGIADEDPDAALAGYRAVADMENERGEKGEWGFKALKRAVKLLFALGRHAEMMAVYGELLTYTKTNAVTRNYSEKALNSILDLVSVGQVTRAAPAGGAGAGAGAGGAGEAMDTGGGACDGDGSGAQQQQAGGLGGMLESFYNLTLDTLAAAKNDRLWFKINVKLGKPVVPPMHKAEWWPIPNRLC